MSKKWQLVTIQSIQASKKHATTGGPFGSKLVGTDYVENGVPVIRGTNLPLDSRFSLKDFVFVSEEKADSLIANHAHPGDVVFTQRGTLGQVGVIPKACGFHRFIVSQSQMKLTVDESQCDPEFVYYYFRSDETVKTIKGMAISSGVPHINLTILREFPVPKPPLQIQRKIGAILSAYDDLIENNTRRIAILEEMAQAIYREWFVNFRFPGHENVKLVDSPLGAIPAEWEPKTWGELVTLEYGKGLKGYKDAEGPVPVYGTNGPIGFHSEALCKRDGIIIGRKGAYRGVEYCDVPFRVIDTAFYLNPTNKRVDLIWAYYKLLQLDINKMDSGSAIPSTSRDAFYAVPVLLPQSAMTFKFRKVVDDLMSNCRVLRRKNENLRKTRDLLLPKLISGQLDVEELDIDTGLTNEALEEATA